MNKYKGYVFSVVMVIIIVLGYECVKEAVGDGVGKTENFIALLLGLLYVLAPTWAIGYASNQDSK